MSLETITRPKVATNLEPLLIPDSSPSPDLARALVRISQALSFRVIQSGYDRRISPDGSHLNRVWPLMTAEWLIETSARIAEANRRMEVEKAAIEERRNLRAQEKQANS